jgi:hypothetical protein
MRLGWRSSSMQMEEAADNKVRGVSTAGVLIQLEHVAAMSSAADITEYPPSDVAKGASQRDKSTISVLNQAEGVGFKFSKNPTRLR